MSDVGRAARSRAVTWSRKTRAGVLLGASAVLAFSAGCSSSASSTASASSSVAGGTTSGCSGAPIKLMTFFSLSGPLAVFGNDVPQAASAAVKAVNATCAAGRPLQVTVCDDQSTPSGSIQCGEKARTNGTLAIIGDTAGPGGSAKGAETANLPAVFNVESTSWDNSSSLSYPDWYPLVVMAGQIRLAEALGKKSFTLAAVDIPDAHLQGEIGSSVAKSAGISFNPVYFPLDTTDFSSVAAQIVSANTGALDFLLPQPEQFITALSSVGANFNKMTLIASQGILTPQQQKALATSLESAYEVGGVIPPSVSDNPGIQQMAAEYKAAGETFSPQLSIYAVQEWTAIHALADALKPLSKSTLNSLTSQSLVKAVVDHGQYNLPTLAPFNFETGNPFPKSSILGQGRVFSSYQQVFTFKNGVEVPVGSFQNVNGVFSAKG